MTDCPFWSMVEGGEAPSPGVPPQREAWGRPQPPSPPRPVAPPQAPESSLQNLAEEDSEGSKSRQVHLSYQGKARPRPSVAAPLPP